MVLLEMMIFRDLLLILLGIGSILGLLRMR